MKTLEKLPDRPINLSKPQNQRNASKILNKVHWKPSHPTSRQDSGKPGTTTLDELLDRREQLDNETRLLERCIYFLQNIALIDEQEMPELSTFKQQVRQAREERKNLDTQILLHSATGYTHRA